MTETSLVAMSSDVLEIARRRIASLLPQIGKIPQGTQMALAYVTLVYDLDPFVGDVWAIEQREQGKVVGYRLMFGITARRKIAHRSGQFDYGVPRWLTEEEAALLGVDLGKGVRAVAYEVKRRDCSKPFVGYGVVLPDDKSKMNHGQLALLRAERDALKKAFPVELPAALKFLEGRGDEIMDADEDLVEGKADVIEGEAEAIDEKAAPQSAQQATLELFGEEA